jgi:hypothetical protein
MQKRIQYLLQAWTYRTFKQQNGVVPWNTGTSKPTISDERRMQKGESDIFCMLGRIVLSNNKMVHFETNNIGRSENAKRRIQYLLHAWAYRTFKQQNGIVPWNAGTSKPTISDELRMQKGESDIFCMLGCIVLSDNKMVAIVLWNISTSKPTISDDRRMQKGESNIFCMLGRILLSNNKMVLYHGIPARQSQ